MACKSSRSVTSVEVLGFVSWTASAAAFGECCAMCCEHAVENEPIGWSQVSHHMATVRSSVFAMGVRASSDAGELWCDVLPQQVLGHGISAMVLSGADLLLCGLREVSRPCGTTTLPECHSTVHFACGRASCPHMCNASTCQPQGGIGSPCSRCDWDAHALQCKSHAGGASLEQKHGYRYIHACASIFELVCYADMRHCQSTSLEAGELQVGYAKSSRGNVQTSMQKCRGLQRTAAWHRWLICRWLRSATCCTAHSETCK